MKRTIAGLLCAALVGGAVFAQEVTFFNRLGSKLVEQPIGGDAKFGTIYDRIQGQYESEKFSMWGRVQGTLQSGNGWDGHVELASEVHFNGAFRPVEFFEVILGSNAGDEGLWGAAYLPGANGYGTDASYGVRKWANGEGLTLAFKGAGVGLDGLNIGWNVLQPKLLSEKVGDDTESRWKTGFGVSYVVPELVGIGFGARIDTAKDANQQFGIYAELLAVENLKASVGVSMDTDATVVTAAEVTDLKKRFEAAGQAAMLGALESKFHAFLNAGVEYGFAGMDLPLTVGADIGLLAGADTVYEDEDGEITMMPMIAGLWVKFDVTEQLWADLRVTYADSLAGGSNDNKYQASHSLLKVTPRVHFALSEADEFRLESNISTAFKKKDKSTTESQAGFDIRIYWQHNF